MKFNFRRASLQAALLMFLMGCPSGRGGPEVGSMSGVVTLKGAPLSEGTVQLFSKDTAGGGSAAIGSDGSYHMEAVPVGTYQVQIRPIALTPEDVAKGMTPNTSAPSIPNSFQNFSTSGLEVTVRPGSNEFSPTMK